MGWIEVVQRAQGPPQAVQRVDRRDPPPSIRHEGGWPQSRQWVLHPRRAPSRAEQLRAQTTECRDSLA